jgi:nicotinamide-nucleotide amidase
MLFPSHLLTLATEVNAAAKQRGGMIATAESCTGGLIAALFTEISGASEAFDCGFITYSNTAKQQMLGVSPALLERYGAVSAEVAQAMAEGALRHSQAQWAVAVTGIAGPAGGTTEKPVGTVFIAVTTKNETIKNDTIFCNSFLFHGNREEIRLATVEQALKMLQMQISA